MTSKPMRSDASRNHEAILSSAIAVLADSPQASMRDIADASGTGRTTLYRHFPDRDALIAAIYDRVLAEADDITAQALRARSDPDPVATLADLCAELAGLGDRYRFLEQHLSAASAKDPGEAHRRGGPLLDYLRAGQRQGRIRHDLDAVWLFDVLVALITHAAGQTRADRASRDTMLRSTVRSIVAPPPARPSVQ
jgi:AcrR family transcriptional regulator